MIPWTNNEAERVAVFDREIRDARRAGITDTAVMVRNVARHEAWYSGELRKALAARHAALSLRSAAWPEPRRSEVAAAWDTHDIEQHHKDRERAYKDAREAVAAIRWARWIVTRLALPDVVTEIAAAPCYALLHWRKDCRYKESVVLDPTDALVAEVLHEPSGVGPTFRAVIYKPPFVRPGDLALYQCGNEEARPAREELTWCKFRQRRHAAAWIAAELHKRCNAIWGMDVDLPEVPQ